MLEHRKIESRDLRSHEQRRAVLQISKELLEEAAVQKSHQSSVKQNLVVRALPKGWLMWDFQKPLLGKCYQETLEENIGKPGIFGPWSQ